MIGPACPSQGSADPFELGGRMAACEGPPAPHRPSVAGDQDAAPLARRFRAPMPNARPMRYRLMSAASVWT